MTTLLSTSNLAYVCFTMMIVGAIFVTAMIVNAKPLHPTNFEEWMAEVQVCAVYYNLSPDVIKEMIQEDVWDEYFEEGLSPGQAMNEYYNKIHGLPERDA